MLNWFDNHFLLLRGLSLKCCEMFRFGLDIVQDQSYME
jgi:hypothetical protein